MQVHKSRSAEQGSAILYVFIGAILFGALMYSFARSTSSGTSATTLTKSDDKLIISQIDAYATSLDVGINNLLSNGCSQNDLRFYHPNFKGATDYAGSATYATSPANKCHVFAKNGGGGVTWQAPPKKIVDAKFLDYLFTGYIGVDKVGNNSSACAYTDFMMQLNVPRSTCIAYNTIHDVVNTGGEPPLFQFANNYSYSAPLKGRVPLNYLKAGWSSGIIFGCQSNLAALGHNPRAIELTGKWSGCYEANQERGQYYIYHVLIAR